MPVYAPSFFALFSRGLYAFECHESEWMKNDQNVAVFIYHSEESRNFLKNISVNYFSSSKSERPCHWGKTIILKIIITSAPCIPQKNFM